MSVVVAQRYELLELVGEGGSATVWLGRDLLMDRSVAVKVLGASLAQDPVAMERFWVEARTAASLQDAGIARVHDHGLFQDGADTRPYLVMEYLPGGTLAERLRHSPPEVADVVAVAAGILDALAPVHRRGQCHGGIRPSNVMFDALGRVTLVDFGMARVLGGAAGADPYAAPEQVLGQPMDARGDVYAVGALMFEALTGQSRRQSGTRSDPTGEFPASTARDPSAVDPTVPADVGRIVRRALARRPEGRFADAAEMLAELEDLDMLDVAARHGRPGPTDVEAAPDALDVLDVLDLPAASLPPQPVPGHQAPRQQQRTSLTWTLAEMGRRASRHVSGRRYARPNHRGLDPGQIRRWAGPWLQAQQVLCQFDAALGYWRIPDRLVVWVPPAEVPVGAELESLVRAVDHVAGRRLQQRLAQSDTAEVRLPRLSVLLERVPDGDLGAEAWFSGTLAPGRRGDQLLAVEIGAAQRLALEMTVEIRRAGTWTAHSTSVVAEGLTFGTGAWVDVTYTGPGLGRVGPEALKVVSVADGRARVAVGNAAGVRLHDAPSGGLGQLTGGRPAWRREVPHGATVEISAGDHVYFPEVEDRLRLVFE
ncbi:MAG: serine/threonine-protein kinase [Candidatus Nanopelagicales bacterium]